MPMAAQAKIILGQSSNCPVHFAQTQTATTYGLKADKRHSPFSLDKLRHGPACAFLLLPETADLKAKRHPTHEDTPGHVL